MKEVGTASKSSLFSIYLLRLEKGTRKLSVEVKKNHGMQV